MNDVEIDILVLIGSLILDLIFAAILILLAYKNPEFFEKVLRLLRWSL